MRFFKLCMLVMVLFLVCASSPPALAQKFDYDYLLRNVPESTTSSQSSPGAKQPAPVAALVVSMGASVTVRESAAPHATGERADESIPWTVQGLLITIGISVVAGLGRAILKPRRAELWIVGSVVTVALLLVGALWGFLGLR